MLKKIKMIDNYRAIFISDIHGNIDVLKELLNKVNYNENQDYLFILGDIFEKGPKALETLRFVMSLKNNSRCHVLLGNCDDYLSDKALNSDYDFKRYMRNRSQSILVEMATEMGIDVQLDFDFNLFYEKLKNNYHKEVEFIDNLPTIIESDDFILAHAGLYPNNDYLKTDYEYATSHDNQGLVDYKYPKPLIVGHWPPSLYNQRFILNPYLDYDKNVFSIDGANSIKDYGQLNALIFQKDNGEIEISTENCDNLRTIKVKHAQAGTKGEKLIWPYNMLGIVKEDGLFVEGYQKRYGNRGFKEEEYVEPYIRVPKAFVYQHQGLFYTYEFGNYYLEVPAGDEVKLVLDNNDFFVIVKYNGEIGLIERKNLEI